jgi:hypothetical protein
MRSGRIANLVDQPFESEEIATVLLTHLQEQGCALFCRPSPLKLVQALVDVVAERTKMENDAEQERFGTREDDEQDEEAPIGHAEYRRAGQHDDVPRVHQGVLDIDPPSSPSTDVRA